MVEAVGPTGQLGRPGWSAGPLEAPTTPNFFQRAVLGLLLSDHQGLPCLDWIWVGSWATLGPYEPESLL